LGKYNKIKNNYNQTTSKTEQLALANYIADGKLEKHLRKSRRYYSNKSEIMLNKAKAFFDYVRFNETSMYISIKNATNVSLSSFKEAGINIMNTSSENYINLSFSHIDTEIIAEGLEKINTIIKRRCD
jgi:GntR family transcriptional regulator/MocR family aminotransferase